MNIEKESFFFNFCFLAFCFLLNELIFCFTTHVLVPLQVPVLPMPVQVRLFVVFILTVLLSEVRVEMEDIDFSTCTGTRYNFELASQKKNPFSEKIITSFSF